MSNLSEAQLLAFIEKKGNQRKKKVFDFTKMQTSESKFSGDMVNKIERSVPLAIENFDFSEWRTIERKKRVGEIDNLIKEVDVEMAKRAT